jgi:integrase
MVVHFACLTGLRAGEIFHLTWHKMDLANRVIGLEAQETKSAEPRVVFLRDQAYDILTEAGRVRFLEQEPGRDLSPAGSAPLVLPNGKMAEPITKSS